MPLRTVPDVEGVERELEAQIEGCDIGPIVDIRRHTLTPARKIVLPSIPLWSGLEREDGGESDVALRSP